MENSICQNDGNSVPQGSVSKLLFCQQMNRLILWKEQKQHATVCTILLAKPIRCFYVALPRAGAVTMGETLARVSLYLI